MNTYLYKQIYTYGYLDVSLNSEAISALINVYMIKYLEYFLYTGCPKKRTRF